MLVAKYKVRLYDPPVKVLFIKLSCGKPSKDTGVNLPVDVSLCRSALLTVVQCVFGSQRRASTPVAAAGATVERRSSRLCRSQRMGWT